MNKKQTIMTSDEILQKHEDANEMHFHEVDRKWIIEAMEEYAEQQVKATVKYYKGESTEEYAKEKSEKPINLSSQQTAVEWLVEQIKSDQNQKSLSASEWMQVINQAKQMEKEQSIIDYKHGQNNGYMYRDGNGNIITAEEYYNQTYNKNKQ